MNEQLSFLCNWVSAPRRVAAVAPSSKSLATLITKGISPDDAPVIELGAGTGVFTRQLIERGIPQEQLALVEFGSNFARGLREEFPATRVLCMDAARLGVPVAPCLGRFLSDSTSGRATSARRWRTFHLPPSFVSLANPLRPRSSNRSSAARHQESYERHPRTQASRRRSRC